MTEPGDNNRALIDRALDILAADYERQAEFNEHFDSEDPIQIGRLSYPRSKVLYWVVILPPHNRTRPMRYVPVARRLGPAVFDDV